MAQKGQSIGNYDDHRTAPRNLPGNRPAALHLPAERRREAGQAARPVGEQIDVLEFALDHARNFAVVQTHRDR